MKFDIVNYLITDVKKDKTMPMDTPKTVGIFNWTFVLYFFKLLSGNRYF